MIPSCCASTSAPCHVGCWDEIHVRNLARELAALCRHYLRHACEVFDGWNRLQHLVVEYIQATQDPRCERAWPLPAYREHPTTNGWGWIVNADCDDVLALVQAIEGPTVVRVTRRRDPAGFDRVSITETPTFRLPAMK